MATNHETRCQSGRKVVTHDSKSDLPLARLQVTRDPTNEYCCHLHFDVVSRENKCQFHLQGMNVAAIRERYAQLKC